MGEVIDMGKGDAEVVERPDAEPAVPVDEPRERQTIYGTVTGWAVAEQRPVLPAWVLNHDERYQVARLAAQRVGRTVAYHALRLPLYATRSAVYAPRGAKRLAQRGTDQLFHAESRPLRQQAVAKNDHDNYHRLAALRNKHVRKRTPAAVLVALGLVGLVALWYLVGPAAPPPSDPPLPPAVGPTLAQVLLALVVVIILGRIGQPADKPIVLGAHVTSGIAQKPTSELVERALRNLAIAAMSAKDAKIEFVHPIRQDGPGWRADIDLPFGVTAQDVMNNRTKLAANLRRALGCVWPTGDPDSHPGRLILWVGMLDMAKSRQPAWPLLKAGVVSLFDAIPFGTDQRGRVVHITLMFANMLIGAMPRMGKTFALRLILLACALDPTAELLIWELKGTGDLACLKRVAHDYGQGLGGDTLERAMACLRYVYAECERRAEVISEIAEKHPDLCPENKVTPELAKNRALGLHPMVLAIDECQELYAHPDYKDEAQRLSTGITKRGPALGIMKIDATQRPDADSLPKGISANAVLRFCLKVMDYNANDMVLGQSMHKNGIKATMFSRTKDRGIGYLAGEGEEPEVLRSFFVDGPAADRIAERARKQREELGLLTGLAAGEQPQREVVDTLGDVRTVFAKAERIHSEDLLELLAELRPQLYGCWTPAQLAASLKPHGIAPKQVSIDGINRNGYRLEWVMEAMTRRELTR